MSCWDNWVSVASSKSKSYHAKSEIDEDGIHLSVATHEEKLTIAEAFFTKTARLGYKLIWEGKIQV